MPKTAPCASACCACACACACACMRACMPAPQGYMHQKSTPKMTDLGSQKGAQREPKSNPKPTKIEDKNRCKKNTSSRSSWSCLGAILGHFGSPLGVMFIDFSLVFKAFRENSRFSKNVASRAVLDRTWPDLGRFWLPKWLQNGSQNGAKNDKKIMLSFNNKKRSKKSQHRPKNLTQL